MATQPPNSSSKPDNGPKPLSVVTTMYRSREHLAEFHRRASVAAEQARLGIGLETEFVFVNDGSPDDSLDVALELQRGDPRIRIVDLARNHGHHRAMMIGLAHTRGDLVFLVDCDLEEPPEVLEQLMAKMREHSADLVYSVEPARGGRLVRDRILGGAFLKLLNVLSEVSLPPSMLSARLMTRQFVDQLVRFSEREIFLNGITQLVGMTQVEIVVDKQRRDATSYSMGNRLAVARRAITGFNLRLLYAMVLAGVAVSSVSIVMIAWTAYNGIFGSPIAGFSFLAVSIWFIGGLVLLALGILALYVAVIFTEVKQRPYSIERGVYEVNAGDVTAPER